MIGARCVAPLLLTTMLSAPAFAASPQIMRGPFANGLRWFPAPATQTAKNVPSHRSGLPPDQFTIIDVPGAGTASGQGTNVTAGNSLGVASGFYLDSGNDSHGFVRALDGTISTYDADGPASQTDAWNMNDHGTVIGDYIDAGTGLFECYLRRSDGTIKLFDGSKGGPYGSNVERIDDEGAIVGEYPDANEVYHAYVRTKSGAITQFSAPGAGGNGGFMQGTFAFDVNRAGTISGPYVDANFVYHGYLRAVDGTFTEIDIPGAGSGYLQGTVANAINSKGWVSGEYVDANGAIHGFLRAPGGTITTFDAPDAGTGAGQGTFPVEISNRGKIVGWYLDSNSVYHGFERRKDGSIIEFDAPGSGTDPGQGTQAFTISKHNTIAGWVQDNSGVFHGYLLTR